MITYIRNILFAACIISAVWLGFKMMDTFRHDREVRPLLKQLFVFALIALLYAIFGKFGKS